MEAGDRSTRKSGTLPVSNLPGNRVDHPPSLPILSAYREGPAMATAALMNPAPYHSVPHHHHSSASSFSSYAHRPPASVVPALASPADSRRVADESDSSSRQVLPSIQEVFSASKPAAQFAHAAPPTSLPAPFPSTPSRPYADSTSEKNTSPRAMHPSSTYPRTESLPALSDPSRTAVSARPPPPPPLSSFSAHQPSALKLDQREMEPRRPEGPLSGGGFSSQHPPPAPLLYPQTGQLPPGQLPLPPYPASPRQPASSLPSPYEAQRPAFYVEEGDYGRGSRGNKYDSAFSRHFEAWSYCEALGKIATACRTVGNFAEAYDTAAREQHGQPIPSRLPTEQEMADILSNVVTVKKNFEEVMEMVHQTRESERAREGHARKAYEEEEMAIYRDGMKPSFGMTEVKKRRGRAAPPGRCHSCNRIDTPEWRRGPDGARTLCNACGLHYAKLERKRQSEQRSLRPKPSDERT